ncbi:methylmalonyl-CoA epimerase [Aurantiacibacter aquimixticola]|uniref:Methylmalonyl-CoA epimerase n=1 Tax=Aurantiacibacter aquimixticola TaxID=1958945 RepID=A0A419RVM8_9SPHN|nr:methylmalonyl-CoA epimerase [Aurantiacibacter aquimixticola]RJY09817.1 methylmalonyl-CoA epimerase [Aurantiacibacter aquimixticola]
MKLGRLNHIGVATPSIADSIGHYRETMGAVKVTEPFDLEAQGVKVCFVDTPGENGTHGTQIELIEPLSDASPIAGFLAKNPLGGQHHVCFEVEDIAEAREWFEEQGKRILGPTRIGAHGTPIFFLHPKDMMGQLTEIMETPKEGAHWSN